LYLIIILSITIAIFLDLIFFIIIIIIYTTFLAKLCSRKQSYILNQNCIYQKNHNSIYSTKSCSLIMQYIPSFYNLVYIHVYVYSNKVCLRKKTIHEVNKL